MDSTPRSPVDQNPIATLGESVFFYHEPGDPCAAVVGKVPHADGGPVDLVVYCLGKPEGRGGTPGARAAWARGHSVVVFKGQVPHVTEALAAKHRPAHWWSRSLLDVTVQE